MNKKLIVLYEENKNDPKNTWSGTSYQLREALKEYYDVIFVDSHDIFPVKLIKIISKRIEKRTSSHIVKLIYEKLHEIEINNRLKKYKDIPVLEIAENVIVKNDFYLYRDMSYACYPYVLDKLSDDKKDYDKGMLKHISRKALAEKIKREEKFHQKAKGEFYMGQWVVDLMKEKYPQYSNKFIHVGGGFNTEFIKNIKDNNKDDVKRILFVGIDFKRKGGELVIEAFKLLRQKYNDKVELYIAGPNVVKEENGVFFVGKVNRDELSELFSKCDVYCMPSRFEAYGLVFIEALCYGLPIVAYNDFEMKYFVKDGENGYLINNYNSEELFDKLECALFKKEIVIDFDKYIKEFSWGNVANRIVKIIK